MDTTPTPDLAARAAYYNALDALAFAAGRFVDATIGAVTAARAYDPDGRRPDDAYAARTFGLVRGALLRAFAAAPGMMQLLKSKD